MMNNSDKVISFQPQLQNYKRCLIFFKPLQPSSHIILDHLNHFIFFSWFLLMWLNFNSVTENCRG